MDGKVILKWGILFKIYWTKVLLIYNLFLVDTPKVDGQGIVLATMESVMVEMIVLTALMKDKIFVVSSPNSGWTQ